MFKIIIFILIYFPFPFNFSPLSDFIDDENDMLVLVPLGEDPKTAKNRIIIPQGFHNFLLFFKCTQVEQ